jgi:PAS domain S-box-containing protein
LLKHGSDLPSLPPGQRSTASILLVDDQPANLLVLEVILGPLGQRTVHAASGEEALARLREENFAVVLLDIMMPGLDGLRTAELVRGLDHGREVPIILMTAGDTPALEGYAHGAVDILYKPLDRDVVRAKVAVFIELFRSREQVRLQASRLAAEERRAEARISALLNASLDAIIGMDHLGRITEFNGAAEAMFGQRRSDVLGSSLADRLVPSQLREAHSRGLARYLATGESRVLDKRIEVTALRADGTELPIELAIRRVATDGPPTFLGYAYDLGPRKRAEDAREFLAQASETLASSIDYDTTLETVVRLVVARFADYCAVELVGDEPPAISQLALAHGDPAKVALMRELRRRYPPDPAAPHGVPHVLRTGRSELYADIPEALLARIARDPEHLRTLRELGLRSAMIVPVVTLGRTVGVISFIVAESARRYTAFDLSTAEDFARRAALAIENARLYRATRRAEAQNGFLAQATGALTSSLDYATTLERVARLAVPTIADSAAVYRLEPDGAIRLTALAAGNTAAEALGRELDALLPLRLEQERLLPRVVRSGRAEMLAELPDTLREAWSPTSRAGEIVRALAIRSYLVVPLIVRDHVLGALALTTSESARRFTADDLALAKELARRAGVAIENAQLYREAQEANRLKDEFLATVSHELRTPLTAILGWTHLLRTGSPVQVARAVDTIDRNAHAQARIVDDILDVSRIITGKLRLEFERVDLALVIQAALDTVRPTAEAKEIELSTSLDPGPLETAGDPARLQQVAWNLLSNAIKFTPRGGRVEVRLSRADLNVCLRVSDTGQGITADFLKHVFERFRQADSAPTRAYGGLGLGLAIVRHLVELHGGHVAVESQGQGHGAAFTVLLPMLGATRPATEPPPRPSRPPPRAEASLPLSGVLILVVDDDDDSRDFIAALLEQHGAQVITAASARAAQDLLEQRTPDVLVSDIGMPGEDGYTLIRQIRALGVKRGVWFGAVALTGYAQASDRNRALSAGYQVHLTKPIQPERLVEAVMDLAGRSTRG